MPCQANGRCANCKHAKRIIIESAWPPERKDCGLMCWLNPDDRQFTKPWRGCPEWEPKEVER